MRIAIPLVVISCLTVSACGVAELLNPANWFGRSRAEQVATTETNPLIPRQVGLRRPEAVYAGQLIDQLTELRVERTAGGAVIRATGQADVLGAWDARLLLLKDQSSASVLTFEFRVLTPDRFRRTGQPKARQVVVAHRLADDALEGIRQIRVMGARNQLTVRR